mmetsp:Transcript_30152/g.48230  ORF Transcript_30152/g.48230 Transcript_30152/m.48230 type:complete len:368 (-) Transcript_30152:74-1177(-)
MFLRMSNNKTVTSRIATSLNLCYYNTLQSNKNAGHSNACCTNKRTVAYSVAFVLVLSYCILSLYIDIPYWIPHGIQYHREHFKWSTALVGDFCTYSPLRQGLNDEANYKRVNLWSISQNNSDFEQTRSRVLLLSYPRSGNHLTRAMIECLLERATYGYEKETHHIYIERTVHDQAQAIKYANPENPYVRKIHQASAIPPALGEYDHIGLIYLIRDPIECILSENKYVPPFWKDYEYQFGHDFLNSPIFYNQWKHDDSKLLLFYEDYFNASTRFLNLKKLAGFFGEKRVPKQRLEFCIEHYDDVIGIGKDALQREATSDMNLHYYRDTYYGKKASAGNVHKWPRLRVAEDLYNNVFSRYDNLEACHTT